MIGIPPIPDPRTVLAGAGSTPNAPLGRNPTGRPPAPGSKALTGRVNVEAGTPAPGTPPPPVAGTPPPGPAASALTPGSAEPGAPTGALAFTAPSAPGFMNMPMTDCSGPIIDEGACPRLAGAETADDSASWAGPITEEPRLLISEAPDVLCPPPAEVAACAVS